MGNEKAYEAVGTTLTIGTLTFCYVSLGGVGFAARDAIDNTCLSNTEFITKQPQTLKESADMPFTALWDPSKTAAALETEMNDNKALSMVIPSVGTIVFYGFLQSAEVSEAAVGDRWEISGNIVITNMTDSGVETGPVFTAV